MGLQLFPLPPQQPQECKRAATVGGRRYALISPSLVSPMSSLSPSLNSEGGGNETPSWLKSARESEYQQSSHSLTLQSDSTYDGLQSPRDKFNSPRRKKSFPPELPPIETSLKPLLEAHIIDHILISNSTFSETQVSVRDKNLSDISTIKEKSSSTLSLDDKNDLNNEYAEYEAIATTHTQISPTSSLSDSGPSFDISNSFFHRETDFHNEMTLEPPRSEELKELWDSTNGFRSSTSQGKKFCLKMTSVVTEDPIQILYSSTQVFYSLKSLIRPNKTQISMTKYDPNKSTRVPFLGFPKLNRGTEVICTKIEENALHPPLKDGLVAMLYPRAACKEFINNASKISIHKSDEAFIATAESECGRLVWDGDSKKYYLLHPAMRTPFSISQAHSTSSSAVKFMLEHPELSRDIVTLKKEANGSGCLEIDTACATRVACSYIIDIAVCAILMVAFSEERTSLVEMFNTRQHPLSTDGLFPASSKYERPVIQTESDKEAMEFKSRQPTFDPELQDFMPSRFRENRAPGIVQLLIRWLVSFVNYLAGLIRFL